MDRQVWLAERRAALVVGYDADAATYGDDGREVPREWAGRALRLIPPGGIVLDAPCGTGKYFPMLAAAGVRVAGADQSAGMLAQARARGIAFSLGHTSHALLSFSCAFSWMPVAQPVRAGRFATATAAGLQPARGRRGGPRSGQ